MNLLIVDDEPLIHKSIAFCLDQLNFPWLTAFHAYNGNEMLSVLREHRIHLALVDIRMPGKSGLEAIKQAKELSPGTEYYIMSAFGEFEYAQEAVRLGVTEYLTKPLSMEDLERVLLDSKRRFGENQDQIRELFRAWLLGNLHRQQVDQLFHTEYHIAIALLTYDSPDCDSWVPELGDFRQNVLSLPCMEGALLLAFSTSANLVYNFINHFPKRNFRKGVTAFLSGVHNHPGPAAQELHRLLEASSIRALTGTEIRYDGFLLPELSPRLNDTAAALIALKDAYWLQNLQGYTTVHTLLMGSLGQLDATHLAHAANFMQLFLDRPVTPDSIEERMRQAEAELIAKRNSTDRIDAVVSYIEAHYCDDISIGELAERFDLSANYLSSLLKTKKNIRFTDFITMLRMKKAKELLLTTDLLVKDISEQVGYHSQSHFTKLFLENTHYTPAEYKRLFSGNSEKS